MAKSFGRRLSYVKNRGGKFPTLQKLLLTLDLNYGVGFSLTTKEKSFSLNVVPPYSHGVQAT